MPTFELKYELEVSYSEKVRVEVCLKAKPDSADYKDLTDAIDTLDKFAKKYLTIKAPSGKIEV